MAEEVKRDNAPRSFSERRAAAKSAWRDYCIASHQDPNTDVPVLFEAGVHMGISATHQGSR